MQLIRHHYTFDCTEIEVEYSFLFFKWRKCYRMKDGTILGYKHPNKYYDLGISEYHLAKQLFKMPKP